MHELVEVRLWSDTGPAAACEWPVGLPRNFDEMFRQYGDFIAKKVASYNKVARNFEDLCQEISCKLIGSDLLNKFVERTARTLPPTMYAKEAAALMGLSLVEFQTALHYMHLGPGLTFKPAKREPDDDGAIFYTSDIRDLDDAYPDAKRSCKRTITWPLQALGFRAYLTQAIHNHFANWCRTRSRKYQDILLPGTAVVSSTDTGSYSHVGHNFESTDWESRLVAMTINDEDMLSVVETVEREFAALGMDVRSVTETVTETFTDAEGRIRTRQRPTAQAMRGLELLDYVAEGRANPERDKTLKYGDYEADGRTLREALKAQQRAEIRAKTRTMSG